ncbi:hypothetical protein [Micromonospora sp. NPDC050495]|uniref:CBU_0592 family membrane protein n=1 Tax=Micromonospora sp. NPDC050495 TaxID=3154936 RepID=UPI00341100FA
MTTVEAVGWLGAAVLLAAYAMTSTGRLAGDGRTFQWLNIAGSGGLALSSTVHGAWPSAALNVVWIAIGFGALATTASTATAR